MCLFLCEGWQNETCFLSMELRSKQYLHKVSYKIFENMLSTCMFSPDAVLLQVFDKMKDQKIICKDMNLES